MKRSWKAVECYGVWLVACGVMRIVTRSSSSKTDVGVSTDGSQRCKRSILQRVLGARNRDLIAAGDGVRQTEKQSAMGVIRRFETARDGTQGPMK